MFLCRQLSTGVVEPSLNPKRIDTGAFPQFGRLPTIVLAKPKICLVADFFVAIALAHFAAVGVEDYREVAVDGAGISEGFLQGDVIDGVEQMFLAAQDVGDSHLGIVDYHGEVIGWHAIGFANYEILDLAGGEDDLFAEDDVGEAVFFDWHGESHDRGPAF